MHAHRHTIHKSIGDIASFHGSVSGCSKGFGTTWDEKVQWAAGNTDATCDTCAEDVEFCFLVHYPVRLEDICAGLLHTRWTDLIGRRTSRWACPWTPTPPSPCVSVTSWAAGARACGDDVSSLLFHVLMRLDTPFLLNIKIPLVFSTTKTLSDINAIRRYNYSFQLNWLSKRSHFSLVPVGKMRVFVSICACLPAEVTVNTLYVCLFLTSCSQMATCRR